MSAATIEHDAATIEHDELTTEHGLARLPRQRTAPSHLALVPELAPARRTGASVEGVQLTRRGRIVILLALLAVGAVLALAVSGLVGGAAAGTAPASTQTRTVVVQPGQTLWSIAQDIAPGADRRNTIARIVELNALPSTDVAAGTRLAVPTR
jgi:hypothetical protein